MSAQVQHWLASFALTQAVQIPIFRSILRAEGRVKSALIAFGATALTHPITWFVFPQLGIHAPFDHLLRALFAISVQALYLYVWARWWTAAGGAALFANGASSAVGWLCRRLVGWP